MHVLSYSARSAAEARPASRSPASRAPAIQKGSGCPACRPPNPTPSCDFPPASLATPFRPHPAPRRWLQNSPSGSLTRSSPQDPLGVPRPWMLNMVNDTLWRLKSLSRDWGAKATQVHPITLHPHQPFTSPHLAPPGSGVASGSSLPCSLPLGF